MMNSELETIAKQNIIQKGKQIQQSEDVKDVHTQLNLKIFQGFVMDERDVTQPHEGLESYKARVWVDERKQYGTQVVKGSNGVVCFNETRLIPINYQEHRYLFIELLKGSWRDPRTSNDTIVMGRGKIRLPPWPSPDEFKSKIKLVGLNNDQCMVIKGYLEVSMKLHRYIIPE